MNKFVVVLFLVLLGLVLADPPAKQLAGPPSEFPDHDIPSPTEAALNQRSAFLTDLFFQDGTKEFDLPVDSPQLFAFNFFSPNAKSFHLQLKDPNGVNVDLSSHLYQGVWPIGDDTINEVPVSTYVFPSPVVGTWKLTITGTGLSNVTRASNYPNVAIILFNDSPIQIFSYLEDYNNEKGNEIGLVARITSQTSWELGEIPAPLRLATINLAEMEVITPEGTEIDVPMHDDGLHNDGEANDGVYGASIKATVAGQYLATAVLEGVTPEGNAFIRSTEHVVNVVDDTLELTGTGFAVGDGTRIDIYLGVNQKSANKYRAYAEVYGIDGQGNLVPNCWISSMVNVSMYQSSPAVRLELDLNWVAIANAKAPFVLKNAYIQEVNSFLPISQKAVIKLTMQSRNVDRIVAGILSRGVPTITEEMREGVRPQMNFSSPAACNLVLVHGYCAGTNPWEKHAFSDFTNACFFLFKDGNLLNDAFAMKVADFTKDIPSWGGVGHSQGGLVLLHLHNYYWTGLSNSKGNRRIQSVGSPYQGCTGAGNAANLIKIFGVACGSNQDLTTDGTKLWLAGISSTARKEVYYATTTYKQGNLFGDYCNMAVNLILQWPNDGTTELKYADLPNGNYLGNKEKWCHTTGMSYPAQYTDSARNKEMNTNASR